MSDKITITKLSGQSNYEVWSLRVESILMKESLGDAIKKGVNLAKEID